MEQKQRVPKGEMYWYCYLGAFGVEIFQMTDKRDKSDAATFGYNNYFATEAEANAMAAKLRAVLNGAEVIKWPSKEEFERIRIHESFNMWDEETNGKAKGWKDCFNWLKSKIVK